MFEIWSLKLLMIWLIPFPPCPSINYQISHSLDGCQSIENPHKRMLVELLSYYYFYYSLSSPLFYFSLLYAPNRHIVCKWANHLAHLYNTIKALLKPTEIAKPMEKWAINNRHVITTAIIINTIKLYSLELVRTTFKAWKKTYFNELAKWRKSTEPLFSPSCHSLIAHIYSLMHKYLSN